LRKKPFTHQKPEVLAIIPARGGSKGIPRKNIVDLCGKPLIAYTIDVALKSERITRVVVSTDDEEIAEISKACGAEVPFLRPKELAGDRATIGEAVKYTLTQMLKEHYLPDAVVQLLPTHPFRNPRLMNLLVAKLFEGYRSVKTVRPIAVHALSYFAMNEINQLIPLIQPEPKDIVFKRTVFRPYGIFSAKYRTEPQPHALYLYHLTDPISLVDIDTYGDFYFAEEIIRGQIFNFDLI
jgi:CMP-N-acetylneuraminic acid synthetase